MIPFPKILRVSKRLSLGEMLDPFSDTAWDRVVMLDLPKFSWQNRSKMRCADDNIEDRVISLISSHADRDLIFDAYAFERDSLIGLANYMEVSKNLLVLFSGGSNPDDVVAAIYDYDGLYTDFLGNISSVVAKLENYSALSLPINEFSVDDWELASGLSDCVNTALKRPISP